MRTSKIRMLVYCALFAAVTAVCSQIALPIGPVPISLGTLAVMLCAMLLGWKYGFVAILCYVLLGLVGAPVFAGLKGGVGVLAGPTGGYIVGYLFNVVIAGLRPGKGKDTFLSRCVMLVLGTAALYTFGTAWFMIQSGNPLGTSLTLCVLPFLPGDAAKIVLSAFLAPRLRKALQIQ